MTDDRTQEQIAALRAAIGTKGEPPYQAMPDPETCDEHQWEPYLARDSFEPWERCSRCHTTRRQETEPVTPEQAAALRRPFPKESVGKLPKGGAMLDYVGHAATTDRILQVDPNWSYEIVSVDSSGNPLPGLNKGLWIKLSIAGVTRYGYGDGPSIKECIGDAIRNAAMRFGVALDLWSKEELEQAHGPVRSTPAPAPPAGETEGKATRAQVTKIAAAMGELGITTRDGALLFVNDVIKPAEVASRNDLTREQASAVINALEAEIAQGREQGAAQ